MTKRHYRKPENTYDISTLPRQFTAEDAAKVWGVTRKTAVTKLTLLVEEGKVKCERYVGAGCVYWKIDEGGCGGCRGC